MSSSETIYLDYAATTPVDERVMAAMQDYLGVTGCFANPSSSHGPGRAAARAIARARAQVAAAVGVSPDDVLFTSGATESDNLAIRGVVGGSGRQRAHLVTARTEHKAVLDTCRALEKAGCVVSYLDCDPDGVIHPEALERALRDDTLLVSIMHVNNETGVVQDIDSLGRLCRDRGALFHVDAAQSVGKLPLDLAGRPVDLVSLTAHKAYGPKGVGALYRRAGIVMQPLQTGGDQELGLRAGTLATHQIVGMGTAFELAAGAPDAERVARLGKRLWRTLAEIPGARLNGHSSQRVPHILNVAFPGVEGESLRLALEPLAVSAGSACTSEDPAGSHVLRALGLDEALAQSSIRFSLGRFTSAADVDAAARLVTAAVRRLRGLAIGCPDWAYPGQHSV